MSYSFIGRFFDKCKRFFSYDYKDYSFKVDLQYGELYFTKKLISFSGKCLSLNLSLKYSQMHVNAYDNLHTYTGFPKGLKTNYHVVLEYDSAHDKYIYEDKDGFKHEFELADNSSTLYFDTFGSGLMLTIENNGYKVFDDDGNYQLFDQYGRLVTIHQKITSSHYAEQNITYLNNTSLKISSITDNYGRMISFSYSSSSIQISYGNNVVITLYVNNNLLIKISKNIDGHVVEDTFNQSSWVLTNIALSSGETFSFSYSNDQINCFVTNIKQDVFTFDYDLTGNTWASVTNQRGVSTRYDFSENESISQTSENNANLDYFKINSDIASCLIKDTNGSNEITKFTFGSSNQPNLDTSSHTNGYSNFVTNNNLQPKKMYLLVVEIDSGLIVGTFKAQLLDYDNHLLAELSFAGQTRVLSFPVGICSTTQKTFRLHYINNTAGHVEILNAKLVPLIGDFEALCTNVDFGGPIFFYGDEPHYLLKDVGLMAYNNNQVSNLGYILKYSDYLKNEKLFYKRSGSFHFWCDDQKHLVDGVDFAIVMFNYSQYIVFLSPMNIIGYAIPVNSSLTIQTPIVFHSIKGKDDNSFTVTKKSHNSSSFHTGYTSYYYEEEETKYIAGNLSNVTYYDYDSNYLLKEVNRSDGYKEMYSYDSNGNLENKAISHTNINQQFVSEYEYDSNDNLIREYKLVGSSAIQIDYSYDNFGNLISIDYPNQSSKSFAFDSVTGERNLNSHFSAPNISVIQNNNYIDSDNSSLSVSNDTYLFNYDEGKLNSVSYNNQQILSITYQEGIYGNTTLHIGETITYSNGGSTYTEYDAFDRVYVDNNTEYSYDNFSNLVRIIDGSVNQYNAYTFYTYDYFNQCIGIAVHYNNLSLSFNRDIYHRLTNQTYTYYGNDLYVVSYSYYNKPDLENAIKQSSIAYDSSIINVVDNVDVFSRLISQTISFGNNAFSKTFEYCVGGSNNTLTNNMIGKVSLNYVNNGVLASGSVADIYSYDNLGNIVSIQRAVNNNIAFQNQYEYDKLSRLNRENNQLMNRSYKCVYNSNGNISFKNEYAYTTGTLPSTPLVAHSYSYSSTYPSRLISFDGQTISYDTVGNPITYRGKTLTWIKGTLLSQVVDGNTSINLSYDGFKQRIKKEVGSNTTNYKYINNQLIIEERTNGTITYLYSHEGIIGFVLSNYDSSLNGVYLYEKNIQQDVLTIRDINNQIKAIYVYDAWGNHKVLNPNGTENTSPSFVGNINPIRYRSYYYDTDLKMYWLTTRYYDPEVGRFISPDHYSYLDYQKLHGLNLYAYSKNNPVMYYDPSGHRSFWSLFVTACLTMLNSALVVVGLAVAGVVSIGNSLNNKKAKELEDKTKPPSNPQVYIDEPYHGSDYDIYYNIITIDENGNAITDPSRYILIVDESWRFSDQEILEFLTWLKSTNELCSSMNIERVKSEWKLHNAAYGFNFATDSTRRVDIYLNASDDKYGWFFDLYYFFFG